MRILFLSRWYPQPADNGSKIRIANLLRGLCRLHNVTLVSFFHPEDGAGNAPLPSPGPDAIHVCPYHEFNPRSLRSSLGFLSSTPRYLIDTHSPQMEALIRQAVRTTKFDLVIASQLSMAAYYRSFRGIPAILEEAEVALYRPQGSHEGLSWTSIRRGITWAKHRRYMGRLLKNYRLCTVASETEQKLLGAAVPDYQRIEVVPNTINVDEYRFDGGNRVANSLVFTGSLRYGPNYDAMMWFVREVYPIIKARVPGVRLTITGDPGSMPRPAGPDVVFTGRIADVHPVLATSAVSIVPLRQGGGTRLKILESMALQTPVVTTSKGVEGLDARDGEHLLVADTPQDFAQAVISLLSGTLDSQKLADSAYTLLRSQYDSQVVLPRFLRLVDEAAVSDASASQERVLLAES